MARISSIWDMKRRPRQKSDTTRHAQASRRIEFARAVQAGIEIAAPTPTI
jgi:hypothetical protein